MSRSTKRKPEIDESALRAQGLVPVTIWTFDVNAPGFKEECERQSRLAAEADARDPEMMQFLDQILADMDLPPYEKR